MQGAVDWLIHASFETSNLGEALMNARRVAAAVDREVPSLRARLAAFPKDLPSFPPVFYWHPEWSKGRAATLDWLALEREALLREVAALEAEDWDTLLTIRAERAQDNVAFQAFYAQLVARIVQRVPEDHPEHHLANIFAPWDGYHQLLADREAETSETRQREIALEVVEVSKRAVAEMRNIADKVERTLPGHGQAMTPLVVVLTDDEAAGAEATEEVLESYRRSVALIREMAQSYDRMIRLELDFWLNGNSPELMNGFEVLNLRMEQQTRAFFGEWTTRALVMNNAIAAEQE